MLVLTRQVEEDIRIGDDICVRVLSVQGGQVRIGIEAPPQIPIYRGELLAAVERENVAASRPDPGGTKGLRSAAKLAASAAKTKTGQPPAPAKGPEVYRKRPPR